MIFGQIQVKGASVVSTQGKGPASGPAPPVKGFTKSNDKGNLAVPRGEDKHGQRDHVPTGPSPNAGEKQHPSVPQMPNISQAEENHVNKTCKKHHV